MATTVLGKRSRCAPTARSPRAKRVTTDIHVHKDSEDIDSHADSPVSVTRHAVKDLEVLALSTPTKTRTMTRPSKHGQKGIGTSGTKSVVNSHFKVSKPIPDKSTKTKTCPTEVCTPRHRDAPAKAPITPQNRVLVPGSELTPRTIRTHTTASRINPYARARQVFSSCGEDGLLVGRNDERKQISDFITDHLDRQHGGCLYVSGPPGTGKSAYLADIVNGLEIEPRAVTATLNCMSTKSAVELIKQITTSLQVSTSAKQGSSPDFLKKHFLSNEGSGRQMTLLILDEIDRIVELDLELLYSLFEWSLQPSSKLILIGIANALDLTDRLLPRLKSRNVKPSLLPFMPYTAPQINDIITTKLRSLNAPVSDPKHIPFIQPAAILLCSKKVASQNGDLRKAFDIIKRVLTLVEGEVRLSEQSADRSPSTSPAKTPLSENVNLSSPPTATSTQTKLTALGALTPETAPKATIAHVAKITFQIFSNGTSARMAQLNIQQKAVLCSLAAFEKKARSSLAASLSSMTAFLPPTPSKSGRGRKADRPISTKQLYESYAELCGREKLLHALSSVEFRDVLAGLETLGLIEFVGEGNGRTTGGGGGTLLLGLMTPPPPSSSSRTPGRKGRKKDFGQMSLGAVGGDGRRVASVVGFKELSESLSGPGSEILREILEG